MAEINIVIEICGSAGEGTISSGEILSRHMCSQGFEIMSFDTYPSEIRGFGKCVAHSRISTEKIYSPGKITDILVALNDTHSISQLHALKEQGILIFDSKPSGFHEENESIAGRVEPGIVPYGIPLLDLAQKAAGNSRGKNMVALGAICALFDINEKKFIASIKKKYANKKKIIIDNNINSFLEGYKWTSENITKIDTITFKNASIKKNTRKQIIVNGNQALAQAAIDSDIHLYAGYPITPATKIMEILSKELPKKGGVMIQTEDEISAIGNVIGAGYAGKRAMTATSGPGFCLMTEFSGLSVMAEVPAIIVNSQRGGPSTGLPTNTEQCDLNIALHGGSGESPRIVIAPTSVADCYDYTVWAFYLAEKYQTLVIILLDFFLSNSIKNIDEPKPPTKKFLNAHLTSLKKDLKNYKRYNIMDNGVSPRNLPGTPNGMFTATGLEHDEMGRPNYSGENHKNMVAKRQRKLDSALKEIPKPVWTGNKKSNDIGIISWGSSAGAVKEAVRKAQKKGIKAASLSPVFISPLQDEEILKFSKSCKKILVPELNFTGQFANIIAPVINRKVERLNIINCLPMASEDILYKTEEMVSKKMEIIHG